MYLVRGIFSPREKVNYFVNTSSYCGCAVSLRVKNTRIRSSLCGHFSLSQLCQIVLLFWGRSLWCHFTSGKSSHWAMCHNPITWTKVFWPKVWVGKCLDFDEIPRYCKSKLSMFFNLSEWKTNFFSLNTLCPIWLNYQTT